MSDDSGKCRLNREGVQVTSSPGRSFTTRSFVFLPLLSGAARNPIQMTDLPLAVSIWVNSEICCGKGKYCLRPPHACDTHHDFI